MFYRLWGAGRFPLAKPVEPAAQGFAATGESVAPPAKVTIHRGIGKGRSAFFFCPRMRLDIAKLLLNDGFCKVYYAKTYPWKRKSTILRIFFSLPLAGLQNLRIFASCFS